MQTFKNPSKQAKILLLVIVSGIVLFLAIYYRYNKYSFINNKVQNLVAEKSDSLYRITYDSLSVDELGGNVYIKNLAVSGDTIIQNKYLSTGDTLAASMLIEAKIPLLKVEGFKSADALLSKQLACNKIIITDPRITINVYPGQPPTQAQLDKQGQRLYKRILGKLKMIQADSVLVLNAEVVVFDHQTKEIKLRAFNSSIFLHDILIDSLHNRDTTRTFFSRDIGFHTDKVIVGEQPVLAEATNVTYTSNLQVLSLSDVLHNNIENKGYKVKGENIVITGLKATGSLDALQVSVGRSSVAKLQLDLLQNNKKPEGSNKKKALKPILSGWVKKFSMAAFAAGNVSIYTYKHGQKKETFSLNNSSINISDLILDTTSLPNASLLNSADNVVIKNNVITFTDKDKWYTYNARGLMIDMKKKTASVTRFDVLPLLSETAFANKAVVQKDRYQAQLNNVQLSGIDFRQALEGALIADNLVFKNSRLQVYRDISIPGDGISKVGNAPHQALHKIKLPINVKQVNAINMLVEYKERNPLSDTSGTISFNNGNLVITNITNAPKPISQTMNASFKANFINQIPIAINISFKLNQVKEGIANVSVSTGAGFNGSVLNRSIEPMGMISINKGYINSLQAEFTTDNYYARGKVDLQYDDLKIILLKRKNQSASFNKRNIVSLFANAIIKNSNPKNGQHRIANVQFRRNDYKSFFNMIWKATFTGMRDVIGAK